MRRKFILCRTEYWNDSMPAYIRAKSKTIFHDMQLYS